MLIRRETPADLVPIRALTDRAFAPSLIEGRLVDELRPDPGWIPSLSLVAELDGVVVGHVVCSRATVAGAPVLGLGPLSVDPPHQRRGVGSALMHAVLGAADALDEPLVVLLGDPRYYHRFGFVLADQFGIEPPVAGWEPHFQARPLATYPPSLRGPFRYADPFTRTF
jgi:putative acetyltransferase